jgi:hypothetical protein
MKFIRLTYTDKKTSFKLEYIINCDKISVISNHGGMTWVEFGHSDSAFKVDQTPEEIIELINGGNK